MQMKIDGVDFDKFTNWMDQNRLGEGRISAVSLLAGGTQNILVKFTRSGRDYVLRRPPIHLRKNSNETMRREARMLAAIKDSDVPHPRLIAACPSEDVLGASFYLMEPVNGFNPSSGDLPSQYSVDPSWRWQMGMELVNGIAKLGALDYKKIGLEGFGKPENFLERQVDRWAAQLKSYEALEGWTGPGSIPGVDDVANWLNANRPSTYEPGIIHGDFHLANVMFRHDEPKLAAIIDWELTTIGDPLLDLGWLMATWRIEGEDNGSAIEVTPSDSFASIDELIEHYAKQSARDLSQAKWYGVLGCYKLGIILEGTHARACVGKAPKETGDQLHSHTISLFQRALNWI